MYPNILVKALNVPKHLGKGVIPEQNAICFTVQNDVEFDFSIGHALVVFPFFE